jgi:hypothetical protein
MKIEATMRMSFRNRLLKKNPSKPMTNTKH